MVKEGDNSSGIVGVTLGILSIIISGTGGIVMGIVGFVFALKQGKKYKNSWSKAGIILNVIGIVLGIIFTIYAINQILTNSDVLSQLQNLQVK